MGNVKWRLRVLKFKPACIYFTLMYETKLRQLAMITHGSKLKSIKNLQI